MLEFACPACRKALRGREELAGKRVKCPGCGKAVPVPAPAPVASPTPDKDAPPVTKTASRHDANEPANAPANEPTNEQPTVSSFHRMEGTIDDVARTGSRSAANDGSADPADFLAPAQGPDEIGRLGSYRVLQVLGRGGMGVVFLAEDLQLERKVALKTMLPAIAANPTAKNRFLREAKLAASIEHDHIVAIFQVGEDRGVPYLAMPLLRGQPLDDVLRESAHRGMPVADALRIAREIAEGLAAAHVRGLIHRDIKPGNIWLEGERQKVKILDFGLARAADDAAHLTQSGAIVGTPAYMAPEQARGMTLDGRADLFSLGCVLYEMLTGRRPFVGKDTISILSSLALDTPAAPSTINPAVPAGASALVMMMLEKSPADRPASAAEVATQIGRLTNPSGSASARPAARRRALPLVMALAAAGLAAVLALVAYVNWPDRPPANPNAANVANVPPKKEADPGPAAAKPPRNVLRFAGRDQYLRPKVYPHPVLKETHTGPFTLEAWIMVDVDKIPSGHFYVTFHCDDWYLHVTRKDDIVSWGLNASRGSFVINTVDAIEKGVPQHLAVVYDNGSVSLFIDGRKVGEKPAEFPEKLLWATFAPSSYSSGKALPGFFGTISDARFSTVARYHKDFVPTRDYEIDDATVGAWKVDEGKGATVFDRSKYQNHYMIEGATWDAAPPDPAAVPAPAPKDPPHAANQRDVLQFAGPNQYLTPHQRMNEAYNGPFTVESWVAVDVDKLKPGPGYITSHNSKWQLHVNLEGDAAYWHLHVHGGEPAFDVKCPDPVAPNVPQHLAVVHDKGRLSLYVDGRLADEPRKCELPLVLDWWGLAPSPGTALKGAGFFGTISDARISKIGRYRENFVPTRDYKIDDATVGAWKLDEGVGKIANDQSKNRNHAVITGATWVKTPR